MWAVPSRVFETDAQATVWTVLGLWFSLHRDGAPEFQVCLAATTNWRWKLCCLDEVENLELTTICTYTLVVLL